MMKCGYLPQNVWEKVKTLRKIIEKQVRMKSHLEYDEECRLLNVVPKGKKIKNS